MSSLRERAPSFAPSARASVMPSRALVGADETRGEQKKRGDRCRVSPWRGRRGRRDEGVKTISYVLSSRLFTTVD